MKRETSAALVITALEMIDDQQVTSNNIFKEQHAVTKAKSYICGLKMFPVSQTVNIKDLSFI